ncbi:hypothetical protein WUBG_02823 [Wuchereria bancrofti]|uniref:Uncharacterized protein n=1 Tax=Wuchereria bancrofti TaxID=6293 RepID=J9F9M3_WUCBA|nr:hypothetical protein WUBG_02823 [Wuchereria bancrofti]
MGRASLRNNQQSKHRTSTLRKINDGGITKELTAAEKRKRMIEAGTKYAAQNRKIKTDYSTRAHFMKFSVKTVPGSSIKIGSCKNSLAPVQLQRISSRNKQIAETPSSQKAICKAILNHSDAKCESKLYFAKAPLKPINEIFERDDAALTSILNRCPQNSISGRASIFRGRERPSLFPNGINPLDTAAVKFAKPLPLTALTARSFSMEPIISAKVDSTSILVTPSSSLMMSKRTPGKTVRFDESVDFRSPKIDHIFPETSVPKINKSSSLETTDEMILDLKVKFDVVLEKLRNLPARVFTNLEEAVRQIASEKSRNAEKTCNGYPSSPTLNLTTESFSESQVKEVLPSCFSLSVDCIASRTRRKVRISQVYINQQQEVERDEPMLPNKVQSDESTFELQ